MDSSFLQKPACDVFANCPDLTLPERSTEFGKIPWWLWPNLLSLDAPLVAVLWTIFLGKIFLSRIDPLSIFILFASTWSVYSTDRLLDGFNCVQSRKLRRRHFFASAHRLSLGLLTALTIIAVPALSLIFLPNRQVDIGLVLLLFVVAYLVVIHAAPENIRTSLPKELLVGTLFAAGTGWPLYRTLNHLSFLPMLGLFACLCSLNCLAIERWETEYKANRSSLRRSRRIGLQRQLKAGTVLIALVAITPFVMRKIGLGPGVGFLGIWCAAILLAEVNINRNHFSAEQLRVLADVVLAVPAVAGILLLAGGQSWWGLR